MAMLRLLSLSVVYFVLLHGCLDVAEGWKQVAHDESLAAAPAVPPKCITPKGACACETDQGLIDLSALDNKDGTKPFFENVTGNTYKYNFNPCTPFTTSKCQQAAMCECYKTYYCTVIGTHTIAKFQNDPSTQQLQISYPTGDDYKYMSVVDLVCDQTKEGTLTYISTGNPYIFTLTSRHACPKSSMTSGSMSVGTILIIVFFSIVGVCLIGGILLMHFARGAQGVEKIPNSSFWMAVPGMVGPKD
jgi:hypothetical protein